VGGRIVVTGRLGGRLFGEMMVQAVSCLERHRDEIDALNVFPVPDGDTGQNMVLTMQAAVRQIESAPGGRLCDVTEAVSQGSLMGARGNSGVILSQLFRGFHLAVEGHGDADAPLLAAAFERGVETAYRAVMKPVEGTILTVAREAARAAGEAAFPGAGVAALLEAALAQGRDTLARTPQMLPALARAGVVDAGGRGLLCILEGALMVLQDPQRPEAPPVREPVGGAAAVDERREREEPRGEEETYPYDTQVLVRGQGLSLEDMRRDLEGHGDSLLVVGTPNLVKVHIHTAHPGRVLEYCLELGDLAEVVVENMREQRREFISRGGPGSGGPRTANSPSGGRTGLHGGPAGQPGAAAQLDEAPQETTPAPWLDSVPEGAADGGGDWEGVRELGVACVALGDGLAEIFRSLGADEIIEGGQTMNPSTEDILQAVNSIAAQSVLILPNNKNVILAAEQVKSLTDKKIHVLPTTSIPQGLASMIAWQPEQSVKDNLEAMNRAAAVVHTGLVTYAVRSATVGDHEVDEGAILGLDEGQIRVTGEERDAVTRELVSAMAGADTEIISLFYGADVDAAEARELSRELQARFPEHEIEVHYGGQPHHYYIISVE